MNQHIITTILSLSGGILTTLGIIINNRQQTRREMKRLKFEEEKEAMFEEEHKIRMLLKEDLALLSEIHLLLSEIEDNYSTTSNLIDIETQITANECHSRHKKHMEQHRKLQMLTDLYYPDFSDYAREITCAAGTYWMNQQLLINTDTTNKYDVYYSLFNEVIRAGLSVRKHAIDLKCHLVKVSESKRELLGSPFASNILSTYHLGFKR